VQLSATIRNYLQLAGTDAETFATILLPELGCSLRELWSPFEAETMIASARLRRGESAFARSFGAASREGGRARSIGRQTPLPADLEQAAGEQVAYWFQNSASCGTGPKAAYTSNSRSQFIAASLRHLEKYRRWTI
jgi:hypothetical protein